MNNESIRTRRPSRALARSYALFAWPEGRPQGGANDFVATGSLEALTRTFIGRHGMDATLTGHIAEARTLSVILIARGLPSGDVQFSPPVPVVAFG